MRPGGFDIGGQTGVAHVVTAFQMRAQLAAAQGTGMGGIRQREGGSAGERSLGILVMVVPAISMDIIPVP